MTLQSNLCVHVWAPFATSVTTATASAILSITTVPGNLMICWAVIWNPTRNLRSSFNYLVLNLAIADLLVGTVTEPVFVVFHLKEAATLEQNVPSWVVGYLFLMTSTASVLSIVTLAVNRYQTANPDRIQRSRVSTVVATSSILWIFSIFFPGLITLAVDFYKLMFIFANTAVFVSAGVLVFIYYYIYRNLRQHDKNTKHIRSNGEQKKRVKQEDKITISLVLIVISFLLCALPSFVMIYIINLCHTCSCMLIHWLRDLLCLLFLLNSASNQFLYAWRMRPFRKAFRIIPARQWFVRRFERGRIHQKSPQVNEQTNQGMGGSRSGNAKRERMAQCWKEMKPDEVQVLPLEVIGREGRTF